MKAIPTDPDEVVKLLEEIKNESLEIQKKGDVLQGQIEKRTITRKKARYLAKQYTRRNNELIAIHSEIAQRINQMNNGIRS